MNKKSSIVSKIATKKSVLIPLALSPAGVLLFVSLQSNQPEQNTEKKTSSQKEYTIADLDEHSTHDNQVGSGDNQKIDDENADINKTAKEIEKLFQEVKLSADNAKGKEAIQIAHSKIGTWENDNYDDNNILQSSFSLDIEDFSNESIKGNYCYISSYGKKIDCPVDFSGSIVKDKSSDTTANNTHYLIKFNSSFDNLAGQATLEFTPDQIVWNLKKFPADLGVSMPKKLFLAKQALDEQALD